MMGEIIDHGRRFLNHHPTNFYNLMVAVLAQLRPPPDDMAGILQAGSAALATRRRTDR